jgi:hypothetical protein
MRTFAVAGVMATDATLTGVTEIVTAFVAFSHTTLTATVPNDTPLTTPD